MIDLVFKNEYDVYVFDTAPTANAWRLLGMSKVYAQWVNKMMKSRDEARTLRELLFFTKTKEVDPLMEYLVSFCDRMEHARKFVRNRVAMQQEHMQTIWREFDGSVRAIVPLFETEIRGVTMLQRLCDAIYAADGAKCAPGV